MCPVYLFIHSSIARIQLDSQMPLLQRHIHIKIHYFLCNAPRGTHSKQKGERTGKFAASLATHNADIVIVQEMFVLSIPRLTPYRINHLP